MLASGRQCRSPARALARAGLTPERDGLVAEKQRCTWGNRQLLGGKGAPGLTAYPENPNGFTRTQAVKCLTCAAIAAVLLVFLAALAVQTFLGSRAAIVRSSSMAPAMPEGSLAVVQPTDPASIEVGDIIVYTPEDDAGIILCHRVIQVTDGTSLTFHTKGDANEDPDPWEVPASTVRGKVAYTIPHVGYVLHHAGRVVQNRLGFAFLIVLPTLFLVGNAARDLSVFLKRGRESADWQGH